MVCKQSYSYTTQQCKHICSICSCTKLFWVDLQCCSSC